MAKPFAFYVQRFSLSLIGVGAVLYGLAFLLTQYASTFANTIFAGPGGIGFGMVLFLLPSLQLGQSFFRHEDRTMRGGEAWGLAFVCAFVFLAATVAVSYVFFAKNPQALDELSALIAIDPVTALPPLVFLPAVIALIYRLFFWAAIKGQFKRAVKAG